MKKPFKVDRKTISNSINRGKKAAHHLRARSMWVAAESVLSEAKTLRQAGKAEEAVEILESSLAEAPENTYLLKELANARFATRDFAGVEEALRSVEAVEPLGRHTKELRTQARAQRVIPAAKALRQAGKPQEAISILESSLAEAPENVPLLKELAIAQFECGHHEGVIQTLDRVLATEELGEHTSALYARSVRRNQMRDYTRVYYYVDPELPDRPSVDQMITSLAEHDLISFDIFDTAIVRAVAHPHHIFRIMGSLLAVKDFAQKRVQAESHARRWKDRHNATREVTLDEIYQVLGERHGDVSGWQDLELNLEVQLTRVNPYILEVYQRLRAMGKRLVFTSDMYLPKDTLAAMLARGGYTEYEAIFLSNEHAARKGDGTLQRILVNEYGPDVSIAHVGDVFDADVTKTIEAGIAGIFNPNQHRVIHERGIQTLAGSFYEAVIDNALGTGLWDEGLHYTHGFRVGGILALGYVEFLEELAKQKRADKIMFLGRDCHVLSKIYSRFFGTLPTTYVDTSRVAGLMLTSEQNFEDYLSRTVFRGFREPMYPGTISELLCDAGFDYLVGHLEQEDIEPLQFPASADEDRLRDFFWSKRDIIEEHLAETKAIAKEYLAQAVGDAETVLVVDVGWTGTCITTLRDFFTTAFRDKAPTIFGALLGTSRSDQVTDALSDGTMSAYVYSPMANTDITWMMMPPGQVPTVERDLLTHPVEYLLTESKATTVSYARDKTGKPVAVRGANVPRNAEQTHDIQRGIIDFIERYFEYSQGLGHLRRIGPYTAFQPMRDALEHPTYLYAVYKDFLYDAVPVLHGDSADFGRFGDLFEPDVQRASFLVERGSHEAAADGGESTRRILFVSPEMKHVGAPRSLLRLCKVASGLGFEPLVWTERPGSFSNEFEAHGFPVSVVSPEAIDQNLIEDLKQRRVDLVVCNTVVTDRYVHAFEGRLPVVWYVREATNLSEFLRGRPQRSKNFRSSSSITVVSDYAAQAVAKYADGDVEVVHNAVEDVTDLALPYEPKKDGIVRFVQLGTIEHRKGYDVLVAAFKAMPEAYRDLAELHFAGGFINSATSFASYVLGQMHKEPSIHFHGLISDERRKIELLSQMDVVVVASRDESCSLVALEGAMLSKPLIVTDHVGGKYMVGTDNGAVVSSGDVSALRDAFMRMIDESAAELRAMGDASRRKYDDLASMDVHTRELEQLFTSRIQAGPVALPHRNRSDNGSARKVSDASDRELIVSLTSFPPRMPTLAGCITSLKGQSKRPDRIILWLSEEEFPSREADVPKGVLDLVDEQFVIKWVKEDLGPHKKYFTAMQEYPDAIIITVDDDVSYDAKLVATLYQGHLDRPHCIVASRAHLVRFRPDGALRAYDQWGNDHQHLREAESYSLLPTGIGGVLYPPGAVPPEAFDAEAIRTTCLFADDLWLKILTSANGYPVWMPRQQFKFKTMQGSQGSALYRSNAFKSGNDIALKAILESLDDNYGLGESILRRIQGVRDDGTFVGPGDSISYRPFEMSQPSPSGLGGDVVLHIGAQKTASTLVQQVLRRDKEKLRSRGFNVVSRNVMLGTDLQKLLDKYSVGQEVSDEQVEAARGALLELIDPKSDTHLLTNEDFFNRIRTGYFFDHLKYGLETMIRVLDTVPRVVLYVRSQPSYLESLYLQMVHVGRELDFDAFIQAFDGKVSWLSVAETIAEKVGPENLTVIPFESLKLSDATRFYQRFLRVCGVPDVDDGFVISEAETRSRGANRSFSGVAVDMALRCYPLLDEKDRVKFRKYLQENFSVATHPKAKLLSDAQTRAIMASYAKENAELFERFMPDDIDCLKYYT
jgi:glycosyltransferase involved in cell wall biosynthesis/tetratricopeptide (TPR) repeat protein